MLTQATHWMEIAGTAVDALLLLRVLLLRLNRVYLFITLACVLSLLFDVASLLLHGDSPAESRVFLYSRFIYAIVFPLVAWDVFEEIDLHIGKLRRFAAGRLISGVFFAVIFGLVMGAMVDSSDAANAPASPMVITMALVLWAGASTASLAFLITIHRVLRAQPLERPNNTVVWMYFYELSFAAEALYCFFTVLAPLIQPAWIAEAISIVFIGFEIAITGWCIFRLKAVPTGLSSAPENAHTS